MATEKLTTLRRVTLLLAMALVALAAQAATVTIDKVIYKVYQPTSTYALVCGYEEGIEEADIKSSIEVDGKEYPVTEIYEAFKGCKTLTSVRIPASVKEIKWAFVGCTNLTKIEYASLESLCSMDFSGNYIEPSRVGPAYDLYIAGKEVKHLVIPEGVTEIVNYMLEGCSGLESVTIPESVTSIGNSAFCACSGLTSLQLPESVASIGYEAFRDCTRLTNVNIPAAVTSIAGRTFSGCTSLASQKIPETVTSIAGYAFKGCNRLEAIEIPASVATMGVGVFEGCAGLETLRFNAEACTIKLETWDDPTKNPVFPANLKTAVFGEKVRTVPGYILYGCQDLTSLKLPDTLTSIGDYAFYDCKNVPEVEIPSSVTSIGEYAFRGCEALKAVDLPETITTISKYTFNGCKSLTSVVIPESVTTLDTGAFALCSGLTSVTLPETLTSIGGNAFIFCSSLPSITIPESVTWIGSSAFYGCSSLTSISIPDGVMEIGSGLCRECSSLKSVKLPSAATSIGYGAFQECSGLTEIDIPGTVTKIGGDVFYGCNSMKKVRIHVDANTWARMDVDGDLGPKGFDLYIGEAVEPVKAIVLEGTQRIRESAFNGVASLERVRVKDGAEIQASAFRDCTNLEYVCLDSKRIGNLAFVGCDNLKNVYVPKTTPPDVEQHSFTLKNSCDALLIVPKGCIWKYQDFWGWVIFEQIIASDFSDIDAIFDPDQQVAVGVYGLEAECNATGDLFTMHGQLVKRNASQEDLKGLAPGMYVFGGRKVLVK